MIENEEKKELKLDEIKQYLKIDSDDDDVTLKIIVNAARKFVEKKIGVRDETDPRVQMLVLAVTADMYDKREMTTNKTETESYIVKTMIMQLQMERDNND